jgi:SAM-dependent methyltransferase
MNDAEIDQMAAFEKTHWWYLGLQDLLCRTLCSPRFQLPAQANVLDVGCGTGANLRVLENLLKPAYLGGFDLSTHALNHARREAANADLYQADIREPEVHVDRIDLALSCDVLSIAGLAESRPGMLRLVERLRRGGLLIVHMPALRWLFSSHDVAIETRDRATASVVSDFLRELGLIVELVTYRLFLLFPAIVLSRLPSMLGPEGQAARSDLRHYARPINATLAAAVYAENAAIVRGVRFPWGSSVYAVGRMP